MIFRSNNDRESIVALFTAPADALSDSKFRAMGRDMASDFLPLLFEDAATYWGESIARQTCKLYGEGDAPEAVKPELAFECMAQFLRLTDPHLLPTRPAAKILPYSAANALDARVARLEFAEAERKRDAKARNLRRKLWNSVAPFDSVSAYHDLDLPHVPPDLDDYLATGLTRMTVGTWRNPCPRGLKEIESLLRFPIGTKALRRLANEHREDKAISWKLFEEFADGRIEAAEDRDRREQLRTVFRIVAKTTGTVYPYQTEYLFEDQRNRPEGVTLEAFDDLRKVFVALRESWYADNRKNAIQAEVAKLAAGATEFG